MVEELGSDYSEIAKSHWLWIVSAGAILLITSYLSVEIGSGLSGGIIQNLLTTLVTAVASTLAIAFSVLFISTQIASERYSPGFTASFVNDPIVQLSFGLGIASILSDLAILIVAPSLYQILDAGSNGALSLLLWLVGGFLVGLNIVFFFLLYPFIRLILIQTTPENILKRLERQYDSGRFCEEAENAEKISNHPMQPVYDFARNSMRRGDYNAAVSAVNTLYRIPKSLLPEISQEDNVDIESVFGPVLNEYGKSLIQRADDDEYPDVISTASKGMTELGSEAITAGNKRVFDEVFSTSYSLFESHAELREETNLAIVECCSKLYSSAAKGPDILEEYIPRQSQLVSRVAEQNSVVQLEKCLTEAVDAHSEYVSSPRTVGSTNLEEILLGQRERGPTWERSSEEQPSLQLKCVFLIMQTTGEVLSLSDGENPPGFVYEEWESTICEYDHQSSDPHFQHLIRRYIELLVFTDINHSSGISGLNRISGIVVDEEFQASVVTSCDSILSEDRSDLEMNDFQFLEQNLLEIWDPIPTAEYSDEFISEVEEIRQEVENLDF